jgi:hypothetical protein
MSNKLEMAESIDGDWVVVYLNGEYIVSDHTINKHYFKAILQRLGVEIIQHEDMEGDALMEWKP